MQKDMPEEFITKGSEKMTFTVVDLKVKKIGEHYKPLIGINGLFNEDKGNILRDTIHIIYPYYLRRFRDIKPGDSIELTAKLKRKNKFDDSEDIFELSNISNLSIVKYDSSPRKMVPSSEQLLVGKIMFDNKADYFDQDRFEILVNKYIYWSKHAKRSEDKVVFDWFDMNRNYTFIGKVIGFSKNYHGKNKSQKTINRTISLYLIREDQTGLTVKTEAKVNYTKGFRELSSMRIGSIVKFDAIISEKEYIKKKSVKYLLKNPRKVELLTKGFK